MRGVARPRLEGTGQCRHCQVGAPPAWASMRRWPSSVWLRFGNPRQHARLGASSLKAKGNPCCCSPLWPRPEGRMRSRGARALPSTPKAQQRGQQRTPMLGCRRPQHTRIARQTSVQPHRQARCHGTTAARHRSYRNAPEILPGSKATAAHEMLAHSHHHCPVQARAPAGSPSDVGERCPVAASRSAKRATRPPHSYPHRTKDGARSPVGCRGQPLDATASKRLHLLPWLHFK